MLLLTSWAKEKGAVALRLVRCPTHGKIALCLASFLNVNLDDSNVEMGVKSPEKADLLLQ